MKNYWIILCIGFLFTACAMTQTVIVPPKNVKLPKNAIFISQSGTSDNLMQTVLDLDSNEMVVLVYNSRTITDVIRTGVHLSPDDYKGKKIVGTDLPVKKKKEKKEEERIRQKK